MPFTSQKQAPGFRKCTSAHLQALLALSVALKVVGSFLGGLGGFFDDFADVLSIPRCISPSNLLLQSFSSNSMVSSSRNPLFPHLQFRTTPESSL